MNQTAGPATTVGSVPAPVPEKKVLSDIPAISPDPIEGAHAGSVASGIVVRIQNLIHIFFLAS